MILQFPTPDDRDAVKTAVDIFLNTQSGHNRTRIKKVCRAILDRYGVTRMHVGDFVIERDGEYTRITAKKLLPTGQRACPGCGAEIYPAGNVSILSIREKFRQHHVSYGCRCGQVFAKTEDLKEESR